MNVLILRRAEADLKRIEEHIEIDNPSAARTTIRRIRKRCLDLAGFSHQGRPAGGGRRGLVIAGTPYLAIYRISRDEVQVLPFSTADGGGPDRVPPSRSRSMKAGEHGRRRCEKILSGRA